MRVTPEGDSIRVELMEREELMTCKAKMRLTSQEWRGVVQNFPLRVCPSLWHLFIPSALDVHPKPLRLQSICTAATAGKSHLMRANDQLHNTQQWFCVGTASKGTNIKVKISWQVGIALAQRTLVQCHSAVFLLSKSIPWVGHSRELEDLWHSGPPSSQL